MENILDSLQTLLQKDDRLTSKGGLLKNKTIELAFKMDKELIKLLLSEKNMKEVFFIDIGKALVFDKEKFIRFVSNKQFLPDSYTTFKNKIGLTTDDEYLREKKDVVLSWPYKDCILEGGMVKEEQKRDEVFWNEILAPDEISRLLDPKVFTNAVRMDGKGESKLKKIATNEFGDIKDNLIIKGNNLIALHSLKKRFAGKVKLIYIDPPYNTGNDSFSYNDRFNHSSWLTFMKNRLEVARALLSESGLIFVHCDDNEQAYLKVLMDEIIGRENFIEIITVVNNPRGRDYGGIANMHEFIIVYSKTSQYELYGITAKDKEFPFKDEIGGFEIRELRNRNTAFNDKNRPNLLYPFYVNLNSIDENGFYEISLDEQKNWVKVLPAKSQDIQTVWRWGREKAKENLNINIAAKKMKNGRFQIIEKYRGDSRMARSVWWDKEVNSERGTLHLKQLFNGKVFNNPKPEETLKRIIEISTKPGEIVLDYHLGSGTTCAVAHKMGRQYIGVEQMDYIDTVTVARLNKVIKGEQGGVSKQLDWHAGGEFIYMELAKWNEIYKEKIKKAKTPEELKELWVILKEKAFLSYKIDIKAVDQAIAAFDELSIENKKKFLFECLDLNHLYINYSDIDDEEYEINKEDKKINRQFYEK